MGTFVHLLVYGISHKVIADVDLNIHHSRKLANAASRKVCTRQFLGEFLCGKLCPI